MVSPATAAPGATGRDLTVYFDGACPVCAREIAAYKRLDGAERVSWVDAARCDQEALGAGLDREQALARLYVRRRSGELVHGASAFAELWKRLPATVWLGRLASLPLVRPLLDAAYGGFLRVRGLWRPKDEALPAWLLRDLRTDHAGETGAVMIYRGVLAVTRDAAVRRFSLRHLLTERRHLADMGKALPPRHRSRLLPIWRAAGWLTGALPALFGARAVYATIEAVETFVDRHYAEQVDRIDLVDWERSDARLQDIRALLEACRRDEVEHRDEAASRLEPKGGAVLRLWTALVGAGSAAAVGISKRI